MHNGWELNGTSKLLINDTFSTFGYFSPSSWLVSRATVFAPLNHLVVPPPPQNPLFSFSLSSWYGINDLSSVQLGHTGLTRIPLLTPFMCNITALCVCVCTSVYMRDIGLSIATTVLLVVRGRRTHTTSNTRTWRDTDIAEYKMHQSALQVVNLVQHHTQRKTHIPKLFLYFTVLLSKVINPLHRGFWNISVWELSSLTRRSCGHRPEKEALWNNMWL